MSLVTLCMYSNEQFNGTEALSEQLRGKGEMPNN